MFQSFGSIALPLLLGLFLCCGNRCSVAIKLNLTASCAEVMTYYCTLTEINATKDDPLVVVNSTQPQLFQLVLRNSLIENVPRELFSHAPALHGFLMHNCQLKHLSAGDFKQALQLRKLVLQNNGLFELPEMIFSAAYQLEELLLGHNSIHLVKDTAFSGLKKLRYLDLQQNHILTLPKGMLADLVNLEHIDLSSNELKTIEKNTFETNTRLQTVLLGYNKFSVFDPNALQHLNRLHLLDISNSAVGALNLQSVDTLLVQSSSLHSCNIMGSAIKIHAGNNQLLYINVGNKSSVRELELHGNLLQSLDCIVGMVNLQRLDVSKNSIHSLRTSKSPLFLPLPSLISLNLASNQLKNLTVNEFLLLQKLTHLDLAFNNLERLNERIFEPLINIEKLYIEGNRLHYFDYEGFLEAHVYLKEIGIFENEWELRYMRKMINFFKEHSVQIPVRFTPGSTIDLHSTTASGFGSSKVAHRHYASTASIPMGTEIAADASPLHQLSGVSGIHPYWTTRDILAAVTLCFVLLILLLQLYRILQEEQCFDACCRRRNYDTPDGENRPLPLSEDDSEV